jgi:hypothetical protein
MLDEYLAMRLARDRAAEIEQDFRRAGYAPGPERTVKSAAGRLVAWVLWALVVRDLGRLAATCLLVMLLGLGLVSLSLFAAATEPRPTRVHADRP